MPITTTDSGMSYTCEKVICSEQRQAHDTRCFVSLRPAWSEASDGVKSCVDLSLPAPGDFVLFRVETEEVLTNVLLVILRFFATLFIELLSASGACATSPPLACLLCIFHRLRFG